MKRFAVIVAALFLRSQLVSSWRTRYRILAIRGHVQALPASALRHARGVSTEPFHCWHRRHTAGTLCRSIDSEEVMQVPPCSARCSLASARGSTNRSAISFGISARRLSGSWSHPEPHQSGRGSIRRLESGRTAGSKQEPGALSNTPGNGLGGGVGGGRCRWWGHGRWSGRTRAWPRR